MDDLRYGWERAWRIKQSVLPFAGVGVPDFRSISESENRFPHTLYFRP
jgi:hypothetical protein